MIKELFISIILCFVFPVAGQTYLMDNTNVTTCSGNFYDSGGSGANYSNNQNITKVFTPSTAGQGIILNFSSFVTESPWDYMEIFDGPTTSAPQIGLYSGTLTIGTVAASSANPTGELTVRFVSNGGTVRSGWAASVSCGAKGTPMYCMNNQTLTSCSGIFTDSGGQNTNYGNNQSYIKTIYPSTPGTGVSLTFTSFDIDTYFEQLEIFDGPSTASQLLMQTTGNSNPGTITATTLNVTGALTLKFTSNGAVTKPGWTANLNCVAKADPVLSMQSGTLSNMCGAIVFDSGGPTSNYGWNDNIVSTYCPPPGSCIKMALSKVIVEPLADLLSVYDGPSTSSPIMATYHNTTSVAGTFEASTQNSSGCITLKFLEDGWTLMSGWSGTLSCVPCSVDPQYAMATGTLNTCKANYTDNGGPYGDYLDSQNLIQTICPNSTVTPYVKIDFASMNLENNFDILRIYNGPSTVSPLIATISGTWAPFTLSSSDATGCLTLQFISDANSPLSGWTGSISCTDQILPVELMSFNGELNSDNTISLKWQTATEYNSLKFDVERSNDAFNFSKISEVKAAGKSQVIRNYSCLDSNPLDGVNYYRLRKVDIDQSFKYSNIVALLPEKNEINYRVFPNPATNMVSIELAGKKLIDCSFVIRDMMGKTFNKVSCNTQNNYFIQDLDISGLPDGGYILEVSCNGKQFYHKLIKLK